MLARVNVADWSNIDAMATTTPVSLQNNKVLGATSIVIRTRGGHLLLSFITIKKERDRKREHANKLRAERASK